MARVRRREEAALHHGGRPGAGGVARRSPGAGVQTGAGVRLHAPGVEREPGGEQQDARHQRQ